jgi:hypothetical protein
MKKGQRAQTGDEGENLAHQRPASAFSGGGWYLDTPLFQGFVGRAVDEDEPDAVDSYTREEVSRGKSHRVGTFRRNVGRFFFRPPSPPQGGRKWTGVLIVVKREE